jgi:hypothetical protein
VDYPWQKVIILPAWMQMISATPKDWKKMKFLSKFPEIALLGTSNYIIDNTGAITGKRVVPVNPDFSLLMKQNLFNHGSVIFKKSVVRELGGFNEFLRNAQDYELWLRIAKKYPVANLDEPLYYLRMHDENVTRANAEDSVLYSLFATKLNNGSLDQKTIKSITNNGIKTLIPKLTKDELVIYHNALANTNIRNGNFIEGRVHYQRIFYFTPWDLLNIFRFFRSYLGKKCDFENIQDLPIALESLSHSENIIIRG